MSYPAYSYYVLFAKVINLSVTTNRLIKIRRSVLSQTYQRDYSFQFASRAVYFMVDPLANPALEDRSIREKAASPHSMFYILWELVERRTIEKLGQL